MKRGPTNLFANLASSFKNRRATFLSRKYDWSIVRFWSSINVIASVGQGVASVLCGVFFDTGNSSNYNLTWPYYISHCFSPENNRLIRMFKKYERAGLSTSRPSLPQFRKSFEIRRTTLLNHPKIKIADLLILRLLYSRSGRAKTGVHIRCVKFQRSGRDDQKNSWTTFFLLPIFKYYANTDKLVVKQAL